MAINLLCQSCKSSMKIGTKKCRKCGESLIKNNKMYRVRVKLPSGKWKTKTVHTLTIANKIELQYKTKGIEESTKIQFDIPTVGQVFPKYLAWAKQNKKSWRDDLARYHNHVEKHLQGYRMDRVMPHHVQLIMNDMYEKKTPKGRPYAPATIKQILVLVKRIFNWSIKKGYYLGSNPCNAIEMPRFDNTVTNPLTKDDLKSLMDVLDNWDNERAVLLIKFALYSGKRRGEILSLTWDNVDLDNRLLTLKATNTKSKKVQTVPLNNLCMGILRRCNELKICNLVFPCSTGKFFSGFDNTWKRIRLKAGIPTTRFHDLRHTYASYLASSGKVDIYTLKELLGHSSIAMSQRYAHLINGALRKAVCVADEVF